MIVQPLDGGVCTSKCGLLRHTSHGLNQEGQVGTYGSHQIHVL